MSRISLIGAFSSVVALCMAGIASGGPAADALRPENDRVTQLERRIAELEQRLARLEQNPGVQPAVQYVTPIPSRYFATPANPVPGTQPAPLPEPSNEINGIKFRMYLLGGEQEKSASPPEGFIFGGVRINR
ncbi:hypothetical protein GC163_06840 [bacterium]|nr:hypothetical protein [bacterium]